MTKYPIEVFCNEADTRAKLIDPALHARHWIELVRDDQRATRGEIQREQSAGAIPRPRACACSDLPYSLASVSILSKASFTLPAACLMFRPEMSTCKWARPYALRK